MLRYPAKQLGLSKTIYLLCVHGALRHAVFSDIRASTVRWKRADDLGRFLDWKVDDT